MKPPIRKIVYNTVLSQTISNNGNFLFIGNTFGDVFVLGIHDLQVISNGEPSKAEMQRVSLSPIQTLNMGQVSITSLAYHRDFLIVGTSVGTISGYLWNDDKNEISTICTWQIKIPTAPEAVESTDVNSFWIDKTSDYLYAGCGDNVIYLINLDNGQIIREFKGHRDYIHCVTGYENCLYSASEDGNVILWNPDTEKHIGKLEPYKNENLIRQEYGKWQGTVSVNNDWLVCGGGPKPSMWHLRSMECTNSYSFQGKVHCSGFLDDFILFAGEHGFVQQYSFNGDPATELPISGSAAYSVVWQSEPFKFMSIAGASNCVDICTNYNYKDLVVKLYKNGK